MPRRAIIVTALAALCAAWGPTRVAAEAFYAKDEALQLAFPGTADVQSRTVILTDAQAATVLARTGADGTQGYIAVARCDAGEVVALGQSLWWMWVNGDDVDNARFLQNLFTTPVGSR